MMKANAASIIRACDNLKTEITGTSEVLVTNRIWTCIPDAFNRQEPTLTLQPLKCQVRNEVPNLKTKDMITGHLVMAITPLTGSRQTGTKQRHSDQLEKPGSEENLYK